MKIHACVRNELGKCAPPEWTMERIRPCLDGLGVRFRSSNNSVTVGDFEFHSFCIWLPKLKLYFNGKGTSYELACAGAHAEMVERISTMGYVDPSERRSELLHNRVNKK